MRHGMSGRSFSRTSAHRKAMFDNMAAALIKHEQITTTLPKAKDLRPVVEKLITLGKRGGLHARRQAIAMLQDDDAGRQAVRRRWPSATAPRRRLYPRPQGRLPLRRRRADGGDRVGRPRSRSQGQGFRPDGRQHGEPRSAAEAAGGSIGARAARIRNAAERVPGRAGCLVVRRIGRRRPRSKAAWRSPAHDRHGQRRRCWRACSLAGWSPAAAPRRCSRSVPQRAEIQLSFAPLVKQAAPAVVNIYTRTVGPGAAASPLFDDPVLPPLLRRGVRPGEPRSGSQNSLGSGVIVRADGLIVTNNHVIEDADEITVVLSDRREFRAEVLLADERDRPRRAEHRSGGDASAVSRAARFRRARGRRSGARDRQSLRRRPDRHQRHRLGARAHPGRHHRLRLLHPDRCGDQSRAIPAARWSTMDGKLVGINTAIFSRGGGSIGIGFAIPANMVASRDRRPSAAAGSSCGPGSALSGQAVTAEIAAGARPRPAERRASSTISIPAGRRRRPASKRGDVVIAVDGQRGRGSGGAALPPGDAAASATTASSRCCARRERMAIPVRLDRAAGDAAAATTTELDGHAAAGRRHGRQPVARLWPRNSARRRMEGRGHRQDRARQPAAMRLGLRPGDIVARRSTARNVGQASRICSNALRRCRWQLGSSPSAQRPGQTCTLAVSDLGEGRGVTGLFEAQAPRPLADRLRPQRLDEVVGQDHLLGRRRAASAAWSPRGQLASMILWGPPGSGKTTIARLLAERRSTCISSRSRRSSPASPTCARYSRRRRRAGGGGRARCSSSTRSTASTAPSRTASCPMSRTARSPWSAPPPRTRPSS